MIISKFSEFINAQKILRVLYLSQNDRNGLVFITLVLSHSNNLCEFQLILENFWRSFRHQKKEGKNNDTVVIYTEHYKQKLCKPIFENFCSFLGKYEYVFKLVF